MQIHQIENWTLQIIDRVVRGQPIEDARVELKAAWIDPIKAARRIAGHANAARGVSILWIVGVDEEQCIVTGAERQDLAKWFNQVESQFNGLAPNMIDLNVPYEDRIVVALLFETTRRPFVIKNPKQSAITFEVPWREGTRVRSARREDLIRLLAPLQSLPSFEILSIELECRENDSNGFSWTLDASLYVESDIHQTSVIPFHRCSLLAKLENIDEMIFEWLNLYPPSRRPGFGVSGWESDSKTIQGTSNEIIIDGPGKVSLSARNRTPKFEFNPNCQAFVSVNLNVINTDQMISFDVLLTSNETKKDKQFKWVLQPHN